MLVFVFYLISGIMGICEGFLINKKRPMGPNAWGLIFIPVTGWFVISVLGAVLIEWWHWFLLLLTGLVVMLIARTIFGR